MKRNRKLTPSTKEGIYGIFFENSTIRVSLARPEWFKKGMIKRWQWKC